MNNAAFRKKHENYEKTQWCQAPNNWSNKKLFSVYTFKIVMYDFWYDSVKPKYGENAKLCYMDTNTFIVCIETWYL